MSTDKIPTDQSSDNPVSQFRLLISEFRTLPVLMLSIGCLACVARIVRYFWTGL